MEDIICTVPESRAELADGNVAADLEWTIDADTMCDACGSVGPLVGFILDVQGRCEI